MNLSTLCPFSETLRETELSNDLINMVEEISRRPSPRAAALILLVAFSGVYSGENYEQKGEGKDFFETCSVSRKEV